MANLTLVNQSGGLARAAMPPGMVIQSLNDVITIGKILAASRFFKDAGTEAQAVAKILRGWELGIPPVAALENIHVIDGKTSLSAHLISAKIDESSNLRKRIINHSNESCAIRFDEKVDNSWEELGISEFTIDEAQTANLLGKKNWQQYPKAMLYARALAQGARWYCATVFMGQIYVPDELGVETDEDGNALSTPLSPTSSYKTSSDRISELLTEMGITDPTSRKQLVNQHLKGRKASDLSDEEIEELLNALKQNLAFKLQENGLNPPAVVDAVAVPVQEVVPDEALPTASSVIQDNREAISSLLDELGVDDMKLRQHLVKQQLGRRKVENLNASELKTVLAGIRKIHKETASA